MLSKWNLFFVRYWATFLFLWETLKRNKSLRAMIIGAVVIFGFIVYTFGGGTALSLAMMLLQLVYGFAFMIFQFIGIFWFLAKPKTVEVLPIDEDVHTWDDYWGQPQVVTLIKQWGELIKGSKKFKAMGGKAVRGILLIGPPGTGKTHLARCMAGSSGVAFYSIDGGGFQAMFFGIPILRVIAFVAKGRKLAKEWGACWLFIDEVDALGSRGGMGGMGMMGGMMGRGGGGMGALSRLLTEMSGIEKVPLYDQCQNRILTWMGYPEIDAGTVMFVGATNKPEGLDPALTRAGRFDKKIEVGFPDKASREAVIEGYLSRVVHTGEIDIPALVQATMQRTPADIESAITADAVRLAYFDDRNAITQKDIENAIQEQMLGIQNPISEFDPEQKKQVAVHEAGHALVQHLLLRDTRIVRVSIIRRGGALGYMDARSVEDIYALPLVKIVNYIKVSLAGHIATALVLGEEWTGAGGDFARVQQLSMALNAHGYFGGFPIGPEPWKDNKAVRAIQRQIAEWGKEVETMLVENRPALDALWEALLEKEDISGKEAVEIMEGA